MPGAVANNFAQNHAHSHDDRVLTEPEWEEFGQDLIARDLKQRKYWMEQHRPDLALNLPVKDIQSAHDARSEEHTSELQSLMSISYAVFCLKKKTTKTIRTDRDHNRDI